MLQPVLRLLPLAVLIGAAVSLWDDHGALSLLYAFLLAMLTAGVVGFISGKLPKGL